MADPALRSAGAELAAVRESLELATRNFTERLAQGGADIERSRAEAARAAAVAPPPRRPAAPAQPPPPFAGRAAPAQPRRPPARSAAEVEAEARRYLADAKRRADRLLATTLAAVERETAAVRAAATAEAAGRRREAEAEAGAIVEEARAVAERIVAERGRRIGALAEGVTARAEALTAGLDDADRVRRQFDAFARALAAAADRVARSASPASPRDGSERRVLAA